jgi:hypothetical protein
VLPPVRVLDVEDVGEGVQERAKSQLIGGRLADREVGAPVSVDRGEE